MIHYNSEKLRVAVNLVLITGVVIIINNNNNNDDDDDDN